MSCNLASWPCRNQNIFQCNKSWQIITFASQSSLTMKITESNNDKREKIQQETVYKFIRIFVSYLVSCKDFNLFILCFQCVNEGNFINLKKIKYLENKEVIITTCAGVLTLLWMGMGGGGGVGYTRHKPYDESNGFQCCK